MTDYFNPDIAGNAWRKVKELNPDLFPEDQAYLHTKEARKGEFDHECELYALNMSMTEFSEFMAQYFSDKDLIALGIDMAAVMRFGRNSSIGKMHMDGAMNTFTRAFESYVRKQVEKRFN